MTQAATEQALLIAMSAVTSRDPICHGELWLLPDMLVRRRLGWGPTLKGALRGNNASPDSGKLMVNRTSLDIVATASAHRENAVIRFSDVRSARLHLGATQRGLKVTRADGSAVTLRWLTAEPATDILAAQLPVLCPHLGANLVIR